MLQSLVTTLRDSSAHCTVCANDSNSVINYLELGFYSLSFVVFNDVFRLSISLRFLPEIVAVNQSIRQRVHIKH